MHILRIDEEFAPGLSTMVSSMHYMWIEIDDQGFIERELGFDDNGDIVHRYPGNGRFGDYGVFDMNVFDVSSIVEDDIPPDEFQAVWDKPSSV